MSEKQVVGATAANIAVLALSADRSSLVEQVARDVTSEENGVAVLSPFNQEQPKSMTPEAYRWMMSTHSIPGINFPPICWVNASIISRIATVLGHPLELDEVSSLVKPDGKTRFCLVKNQTFQPVRYIPFRQSDEDKLRDGAGLTDLYYGGSFFQHPKVDNGRIFAVSGRVYSFNGRLNTASPMVRMSMSLSEALGEQKLHWGKSLQALMSQLERKKKAEMQAEYEKDGERIAYLLSSLISTGKSPSVSPEEGLNNAFASLELPGGKNGNGRH